jgi:hypothetical protein
MKGLKETQETLVELGIEVKHTRVVYQVPALERQGKWQFATGESGTTSGKRFRLPIDGN